MSFVDLIEDKKWGRELPPERIRAAVTDYVAGEVPDYQMAALLMAIRWRGLSAAETAALTEAMLGSGDRYDLSDLDAFAVDKHSTGGVGDKTSLALAPLVATCGCAVPMVSGRGLGHTGGTLDKLESIPGFRTDLDADAFRRQLEEIGVAMGAQTDALVPADRLLYALRDVTATVDDPGLITASILSKKLAEGARALVMDIKVGSGAFCPDLDAAEGLADRLLPVAGLHGLATVALLTDMERPLGRAVGNALEVREAIDVLRGEGPADVRELVLALAGEMLCLAGVEADVDTARARARDRLDDGSALERFLLLIEAQGADPGVVDDPEGLPRASGRTELRAPRDGFVAAVDALAAGRASVALRAGRRTKEDEIDPAAGLELLAVPGDRLAAGEPWVRMHHGGGADVDAARDLLEKALRLSTDPPEDRSLLLERRP